MLKMFVALLLCFVYVEAKELSPVLFAPYEKAQTIEKKLSEGGFKVVATYQAVPQSTTIVYTDETLKKEGAKKNRAFVAVMKVFVDDKEKKVSASNPLYFGKAFMQDDYDKAAFEKERSKLEGALGTLTPSKDSLDEDDLGDYHFMMGMPYYEDQIEVAEGSSEKLIAKLKSYEGGKHLLFVLPLSNDSTLVGYDLNDETEKFVDKIGRSNASLLPWTIKIENGKATILHPKYYIAISYPKLSMGDFMGIHSVPGEIEEEIEAAFK